MTHIQDAPLVAALAPVFLAVVGFAYATLRKSQREDMRNVIREECRPPNPAKGEPPGAIWQTVNGHFDQKFNEQKDDLTKSLTHTVRTEMRRTE